MNTGDLIAYAAILTTLAAALTYGLAATIGLMHRGQIIRLQAQQLRELRGPCLTDTQALDYELAKLLKRGA